MRSNYERGVPVDRSFLRKTARLVQKHTSAAEVREEVAVYALDEATLERIAASDQPDTVKVFNLLKALHDHVRRLAGEQPWLISIGDRAEAVAKAFEERQKTTRAALSELEGIVAEVAKAAEERTRTDLSSEAFAVLWYLTKERLTGAETVARAAEEAFAANPHWRASAPQERELRKRLYKALIDSGADDVVELVTGLLRMLRRARS